MSLAKNVEKKAAISVDPFITSDLMNFDDLSLVLSTFFFLKVLTQEKNLFFQKKNHVVVLKIPFLKRIFSKRNEDVLDMS